MLKNIWSSKCICLNTKLRIFNSNVKSVLLYHGCETWRMVKSTNRKLQTFINTCLRRILKIRWMDKVPNEEIWRQTKQEPIDTDENGGDWPYIQETSVQHHKAGIVLESSGEKKAGPASEYLEAKHRRRIKEMGDHLTRVTEDCPEQSAMVDGC
ncbi:hypothetical protein ElyMa_000266000 [Elysia marginata]|uniref:DUF6451 domain-containing protein n=1 Tax=Elysia marginata TaxID=1093978 RepID=A0AAV4F3U4_9GAST|nr:hypothetical protein ElyMa_000266000 [Elysia marginata]